VLGDRGVKRGYCGLDEHAICGRRCHDSIVASAIDI